jgi:hypothetical protein
MVWIVYLSWFSDHGNWYSNSITGVNFSVYFLASQWSLIHIQGVRLKIELTPKASLTALHFHI